MKRRKSSAPLLLFWSKQEQRRFIDAAERFVGLVNDLENLVNALRDTKAVRKRVRTPIVTAEEIKETAAELAAAK